MSAFLYMNRVNPLQVSGKAFFNHLCPLWKYSSAVDAKHGRREAGCRERKFRFFPEEKGTAQYTCHGQPLLICPAQIKGCE
ncbi:hypothetical protein AAFN90_18825 [Erwiniaceae bacterium CAU 1747]